MAKILEHEIPPQGERQDMTIVKVGKDSDDNYLFKLMIDNGEYRGKRITAPSAVMLRAMSSKLMAMDLSFEDFNDLSVEEKVGNFRVSAELHHSIRHKVDGEWYDEEKTPKGRLTKKSVTYELVNVTNARCPESVSTQFLRRNKFTRR